jgi:hypothetical protein
MSDTLSTVIFASLAGLFVINYYLAKKDHQKSVQEYQETVQELLRLVREFDASHAETGSGNPETSS